ncbi:MAG: hypothetical protein EZS28_019170 [Streblomastix strix]|uniref:Uncharacterized protein n=1 Tax=Streblomastix strix TaxID=222440 RepID=A0A5J4VSJ9_9EUKA|nr:MAG: hypothetical protein EZS28_019170 [Streblomastix strix]
MHGVQIASSSCIALYYCLQVGQFLLRAFHTTNCENLCFSLVLNILVSSHCRRLLIFIYKRSSRRFTTSDFIAYLIRRSFACSHHLFEDLTYMHFSVYPINGVHLSVDLGSARTHLLALKKGLNYII